MWLHLLLLLELIDHLLLLPLLLLRVQRRGLGRRLMERLAEHLISAGCASAAVWVLRDSPKARGFDRFKNEVMPGGSMSQDVM